jgi:hypothetical protein
MSTAEQHEQEQPRSGLQRVGEGAAAKLDAVKQLPQWVMRGVLFAMSMHVQFPIIFMLAYGFACVKPAEMRMLHSWVDRLFNGAWTALGGAQRFALVAFILLAVVINYSYGLIAQYAPGLSFLLVGWWSNVIYMLSQIVLALAQMKGALILGLHAEQASKSE